MQKEGSLGSISERISSNFSSSDKEPGSTSPQWFSSFSISALWESFFGFDQTFGIWGLEVMRQVPRNKRYLGSNFCSGLVTTWKVSTDRKIFKSFQESFQNFPLSSSEGLEEMNKQVKISSQLSMNFFHQV